MVCNVTCISCKKSATKFNGYLVNISDGVLSTLSRCHEVDAIKQRNTVNGKIKHFVLCSDCIEQLLGRELFRFEDFKFKNGCWMTSNVAYILRKQDKLTPEVVKRLESFDEKGVLPFEMDQFQLMISTLIK